MLYFKVEITYPNGEIEEGETLVEFINTRKTGKLTLEKRVTSPLAADATKKYKFVRCRKQFSCMTPKRCGR